MTDDPLVPVVYDAQDVPSLSASGGAILQGLSLERRHRLREGHIANLDLALLAKVLGV